ncbi:thiamine pyrophosphate-dependent enzyme [Kitasatospora sp. NPDC006697]|uniref:thiamine pyrophosphate-dependent enzyme n=1 Tax=Kitasatospora sp. NPDC006697 TaxID=3364020 RepID=UPI00368E4EDC
MVLSTSLSKTAAVAGAMAVLPELPTIFTTGFTSRIGAALGNRPNHFYMTGSMGLALTVGAGVALSARRPVLVLDGDGSLLMNPGGLICAGGMVDLPLIHVVLDDGCYDSTGGQRSPAPQVDLVGWAVAAGWRSVRTVDTLDGLTAALGLVYRELAGPAFIRCLIEPDSTPPPPRITDDLLGVARRFTRHLTA